MTRSNNWDEDEAKNMKDYEDQDREMKDFEDQEKNKDIEDEDEDETKDLNENHIRHEDWRDDFDVGLNRLDGFVRFVEETKNHEEQKMIIDSEALAKMMELNILMLQIALRNEFRLGVLEGKKGDDSSHKELGKSEMDKIMDIQVDLNKYKEIWEKQHREWNLKKAVMEDKHEKASKAARSAEKK